MNPKKRAPLKAIIVDGQECILVPLTSGKATIIDKSDALLVLKNYWYASRAKRTPHLWYAERKRKPGEDWPTTVIKLHQVISGQKWIDHKNGNGLDNRRVNLRPATRSQNQHNMKVHCDTKSGIKGVDRCAARKDFVWRARVCGTHLGYFKTKEEAAQAYNVGARFVYGEFARLNAL